jgi:hypothetical protein
MNETLACSGCGRSLHVPEDLLGQEVKCPACHHKFTAPEAPFDGASVPEAVATPEGPAPEVPRRPMLHAGTEPFAEPTPSPVRFQDTAEWHGAMEKPQKVQAIGIMMLIGGIIALLTGIAWASSCIGLVIPMTYYSFVLGIMAIVKASKLLGDNARKEYAPQAIGIMQIVNIVSFDVINMVLGIITLVLLSDPEVKAYFRR